MSDGTYGSDWVFNEDAGNLDSCNGTTVEGEYIYIVTDSFPYVTRCLNGEVSGEQGPGGGAPPTGAGAPGGASDDAPPPVDG